MRSSAAAGKDLKMRVLLQQVVLPHYRVPVFNALSRRPGLDLSVAFDRYLPSVVPDVLFRTCHAAQRDWPSPGAKWLHYQKVSLWIDGSLPHVVVLEWSLRSLTMLALLAKARALGVRTVLWGHGFSHRETPLKWRLRAQVAELADAVLFYDHHTHDDYVRHGLAAARAFVAPNALDIAPMQQARQSLNERALQDFRERQGLNSTRVILFASRLEQGRGLESLLGALSRLPPDVVLVIIGSGPEEQRLRTTARSRAVSERTRFVGECYDEQQLAPWFAVADVFCIPSRAGLAILHAFAYGLPVIASAEGSGPEVRTLQHDVNGLKLYSTEEPELEKALLRVLERPDTRARLSAGALRTVEEQYTLDGMVAGMEAAIRFASRA